MKKGKNKVCVVSVNWNNWKITVELLKSLKMSAKNNFDIEIIIVDNGSTDDSFQELEKLKDKYQFILIKSKINRGFTGGNNLGIEEALKNSADYIFLLNNDTVVDKYCIERLVNACNKYKDIGIFTPKIYFAKGYEFKKKYKSSELGNVIWSAGGHIDWNNVYAKNLGVDEVDGKKFEEFSETDFATGAAMFVRRSVFEKLGLFDERYYMYFEDVDLCERFKRSGGKIMFIPTAKVWHKVAQSSGIGSDLNDYFITRNRLLFGMGYAGWRTKFALYRESIRFLMSGRKWQKQGVYDFYTVKFGRGSWK